MGIIEILLKLVVFLYLRTIYNFHNPISIVVVDFIIQLADIKIIDITYLEHIVGMDQ